MGGEEEHSLARNLLNFEARDRRLCRGGERRSLACPRQINHGRGARLKANYVECFLGKSSHRLCKSFLAMVDIQICLGAGTRQHATAPQSQVEELHRGGDSGLGLGRLGYQLSLPGKLYRAKIAVLCWPCRSEADEQVIYLYLLCDLQRRTLYREGTALSLRFLEMLISYVLSSWSLMDRGYCLPYFRLVTECSK